MARCANCGCSISFGDEKTKIDTNGWGKTLCANCANLAGLDIGGSYTMSFDTYQQFVRYKEEYEAFAKKPGVKKLCNGSLLIHEPSKTFVIGGPADGQNVHYFQTASLQNILEVQCFDDNQTYTIQTSAGTSGAGKAVVGGLLFGGVGALAGGLMGRKGPEYEQVSRITKFGINVVYENGKSVSFNILLLLFDYTWVNTSHEVLPKVKAATVALCEQLYPYTKQYQAKMEEQQQNHGDVAQQIIKLASLVESGLITKEEFESAKKKLLLM